MMHDGGVDYDDYLIDKAKRWQGCCWRGQAYATLRRRGAGGERRALQNWREDGDPRRLPQTPRRLPQTPVWAQGRVRGARPRVATIGKALISN